MVHDPDHIGSGPSAQGIFIGWLAAGLLGVMAVFTLTLLIAGMTAG